MSENSRVRPLDPESAERVHKEQLAAVRNNTPTMLVANTCNGAVVVIGMWSHADISIVIWYSVLSITAGYIYFKNYVGHARREQRKDHAKSIKRAITNGLALGALWGMLPLFFFVDADASERLLITSVTAGMMCGGAFVLAAIPSAALSFVGPVTTCSLIALARSGDKEWTLVAFLLCVYTLVLLKGARSQAAALTTRVLTEIARTKELTMLSEMKSAFTANVSHEIRTPLNGILGLAQLLEREPLSSDHIEIVRRLRKAGESLLAILNDILDFSKLEAGQFRLDRKPFDLGSTLSHIGSLFSGTARAKGLELVVEAMPQLGGVPIGDALRVEQVLMNLVGNALKFTEQGEVRLCVRAIALDDARVKLRFEVRDTGIGVAPESLTELFKPFTQAHRSMSGRFGGTGLGLSVCKRLVELMGGEIGASSKFGQGSTFWFEVAFELSPAETHAPRLPRPTNAPGCARLGGLRFLVVDDSETNRDVLERLLALEGARVVVARNGQEALEFLRRGKEAVDAVLMDVQMPVMNGLTAIRNIRGDLGLRALPIIALTAGILSEERHQVLGAGANDFIPKPVDLEELVYTLLLQVSQSPSGDRAMISEPLAEFPVVAGLNSSWVEKTLDGDRDLFVALLMSFKEEFIDAASQVEDSLARGDREDAAHRLHTLRGGAGYIGAEDLVEAASALERAIVERQPQFETLIAEFVRNHDLVIEAITSALAEINLSRK